MQVVPVRCLSDNFAYLLICRQTQQCAIVDASEARPVIEAVRSVVSRSGASLKVAAILATHHHHDHVGGNQAVLSEFPGIAVYGHESDRGRIPGQTEFLADGATFELGQLRVTAMHIPGHTLGAVGYLAQSPGGDRAVFTGDTLFVAGCGRMFEGDAPMMFASLEKLRALPPDTQVFCGHEYTQSNLRFAKAMEPRNPAIDAAMDECKQLLAAGRPTVPSTIGKERAINPFLRADSEELRQTLGVADGAAPWVVFQKARSTKDTF
jgi:hydroxyacylglutathione hydrolase